MEDYTMVEHWVATNTIKREEQTNIVAEADEANRNSLKSLLSSVLLMNSRSALVLAKFSALLFKLF